MTLVRWIPKSPMRDLNAFTEEVDRLFDGLTTMRTTAEPAYVPPVDIDETVDAFVLRLDLPGVTPQDIKVNVTGDVLTIRGERQPDPAEDGRQRLRAERPYGTFERTFTLGRRVKAEGVEARHRDGVLEVRVPKADEAKVREIEVRAS
jgi:HSP20 family protein